MSSNIIEFHHVWKKYSKTVSHRSLREDIMGLFAGHDKKSNLEKGEFWALQDIDLQIPRGQLINLSGPNGAGKSTILRLIANLNDPTRGDILVHGRVAPVIELGAGFHPDLSGFENIFVNGVILGMTIKEVKRKLRSIITFSEVEEFIHMPIKHYSSGMYVKLAFSIAIHSEADIYLFDEVIAVGDQAFQEKCISKILEMKQEQKTILFVSHNPYIKEKLSAATISLQKGKMAL